MAGANNPRYNIALVGEPGVGKTSLFTRLKTGKFGDNLSGVGSDTFLRESTTRNGMLVQINIWDTAGGERFRSLPRNYYKDKDAIILVYDLEEKYTLDSLHGWIDTVQHCVGSDSVLVWALFGNKSDSDIRSIEENYLGSFADRAHLYFDVSAKTGHNVQKAFDEVAELLHFKATTPGAQRKPLGGSSILLHSQKTIKRNRVKC